MGRTPLGARAEERSRSSAAAERPSAAAAGAPSLLVRVFTHPACSGCGPAVQAAWKLREAHPEVELRTVSLEKKEGLDEAHAEGVRTIPTLILSRGSAELRRIVGATSAEVLETTLREVEGRP